MKEFINKTNQELSKLATDKREALRVFRFGNAGAKSKNVKEGRNLRKDIARIMTVMTANTKAEAKTK